MQGSSWREEVTLCWGLAVPMGHQDLPCTWHDCRDLDTSCGQWPHGLPPHPCGLEDEPWATWIGRRPPHALSHPVLTHPVHRPEKSRRSSSFISTTNQQALSMSPRGYGQARGGRGYRAPDTGALTWATSSFPGSSSVFLTRCGAEGKQRKQKETNHSGLNPPGPRLGSPGALLAMRPALVGLRCHMSKGSPPNHLR